MAIVSVVVAFAVAVASRLIRIHMNAHARLTNILSRKFLINIVRRIVPDVVVSVDGNPAIDDGAQRSRLERSVTLLLWVRLGLAATLAFMSEGALLRWCEGRIVLK